MQHRIKIVVERSTVALESSVNRSLIDLEDKYSDGYIYSVQDIKFTSVEGFGQAYIHYSYTQLKSNK